VNWPPIAGDPRFFRRSGPFSLAAVAAAARADEPRPGTPRPEAPQQEAPSGGLLLRAIAPLQMAKPDEVSFLGNRKYLAALAETRAGAVIVHPDMAARVPATAAAIVTVEPYHAWARVAALFHPVPPVEPGIHPAAVVAPGAQVDRSAEIGPLAVIGARA